MIQPVDGLVVGIECRKMLYLSRQVITGLGKDANRVQRVVLISTDTPDLVEHLNDEHPDVKVVFGLTTVKPAVATGDGPVLASNGP